MRIAVEMIIAPEILLVAEADIATTQIIEQIVGACAPHGVTYRKKLLSELDTDDFAPNTLPLFLRCADPQALTWIRALVTSDRAYAYYIDDNFWRITGSTPIADYYRHPLVRASLEFSIKHARMVITSSQELARFLSRFTNRLSVLPAPFDFSLVENLSAPHTDEIRIGFAGSTSRSDDLELIAPILGPTLDMFPSAVFEFAGVMPRGISVGERVRFFPYDGDYARYVRFQRRRGWAVGLAPLLDHEANRCKTDNKYREYGGCGIAGIFSDIPPYRNVVEHGVTGLVVENSEAAWRGAINRLISRPDERARIADQAHRDVKLRCDLNRVAAEWSELFQTLGAEQSNRAKSFSPARLKWKCRRARLDAWRLHLSMAHAEGGWRIVLKRIAQRIVRALPRRATLS